MKSHNMAIELAQEGKNKGKIVVSGLCLGPFGA